MLSLLLWMVTQIDNTTEIQKDQPQENWNKLSFIFHVFLPVAGLLILFKQKHIFSRFLLQLDRNCVSVFCPSFSRREKLLKWAGSRLPETWSSHSRTLAGGVAELWSDGSLLCTLINSAIPGACPNPHRHWKKPPLHAQAIAYKYLGVIPIFTESDLSNRLTVSLERSFLQYLNELQQAVVKLTERNETPKSVSVHYIVRGMGLYSGEQHRKTVFYVYPNSNTTGHNSNIIVHIRGPYATYGKAIIPKFHNDLFTTPEINVTSDLLATKTLLNGNVMKPSNTFMRNFTLPFMQYHKKHIGDNIVIDVAMEDDRAKVTYIPKNYGMYEIIMVSNGELLRGCPFNVHILNNISGVEDSFDAEERVEDLLNLRRRKILSKTIDFIDEQMPVTDVLMMYKNKEESCKPENHIERDETDKVSEEEVIIKQREGPVKENEITLQYEQPYNIIQTSNKNEEGNIDMCNNNTDKSLLNFKDTVNTLRGEPVVEKQNSESTSEDYSAKLHNNNGKNLIIDHMLIEDDQTRNIVHTVNNYSDNKSAHKVVYNDVSVSLQLKSTTESTNDDKKVADALSKEKQMFNQVSDTGFSRTISDTGQKKAEFNKVKIPDKFCETQNVKSKNNIELHTKQLKNFINTSNKKEMPTNVCTERCEDSVIQKTNNFQQTNGYSPKSVRKDFISDNTSDKKEMSKNICTECCEGSIIQKTNSFQQTNDYSPKTLPKDFISDDNNNITSSLPQNNSNKNTVNNLHRKNSTVVMENKAIPRRFLQNQLYQNLEHPVGNPAHTSPICLNHIAPEVEKEYQKMSVAEKRKIFAKKVPERISTSTISSFSETENAEGSLNSGHFRQFEGLSVLNYLGSLKKSENKNNQDSYSLCSTMSLPNISSMESNIFQNSVKERRNFWERMSISSSSLSLNSEMSLKRKPRKMTETERCKLIWKKPLETTTSNASITTTEENFDLEKNEEISKSVDDILSLTSFVPHDMPKKYKSMDHSLDKCTMLSIEERKRILLKQNCETELPRKQPLRIKESLKEKQRKLVDQNSKMKNKIDENGDSVVFSSVSERIKKYDSASNLSNEKTEEKVSKKCSKGEPSHWKPTDNITTTNNHHNLEDLSQPEILTVKSHFKRAIKYFKNLEEKSSHKNKINIKANDYRRHSLDIHSNKHRKNKKGGSLNLPSINERFFVSNLYKDVFGDRRGSFKGAVNRSALVDALATFSRKENQTFRDDEDKITYEIFQKRAKIKSRRSIKSIFDVYY